MLLFATITEFNTKSKIFPYCYPIGMKIFLRTSDNNNIPM